MRPWLLRQRAAHTRIQMFMAIRPAGGTERWARSAREAFVVVKREGRQSSVGSKAGHDTTGAVVTEIHRRPPRVVWRPVGCSLDRRQKRWARPA